jgi:acetyl esterase/lipase
MKAKTTLLLLGAFLFINTWGQNAVLKLYPNGQIPNSGPSTEAEIRDSTDIVRIANVQVPDIAVFLPSRKYATGQAVVICPGGGYQRLAYDYEGEDVAKFFNSKGIAAFVLKYRLPVSNNLSDAHVVPLTDAQRAMRLVRLNAEKWNIDPNKVGIMGFSAGGHLASSLSTHFDYGNPQATDPVERLSCRPDFSLLIYPVITFTGDFQHQGSRKALVGEDAQLMEYFSSEKQVTEQTPPAILIHSSDDKAVPAKNSLVYYEALVEKGIKAEMHIYTYGGHGFGLAIGKGHLATWPDRVIDFLKMLNE